MNKRVKEWIKRYLPAEICSLVVTVAIVLISYGANHNRVITALAGTWIGSIGYFGYILISDIFITRKDLQSIGTRYTFKVFLKNIRALFAEFGLAELFDSLLIRPALMYYLPLLAGSILWGSISAKFIADITFYIPAIICYEYTKGRLRKFR